MSTTPATPGPYSGTTLTTLTATTPAAQPPGLAEDYTDEQLQAAVKAAEKSTGAWLSYSSGCVAIDEDTITFARAFLAALPKPEAAEIAALKAALAESEKQFQDKVDEIAHLLDKRDKAQGILKACLSVMPFGNIETHTAENLPGRISDLASEIASLSLENERLDSELAALRQPILADDGRSLGQVAFDKYTEYARLRSHQQCLELVAQKVAAVVLAQAVRRMEAVPVEELWYAYEAANTSYGGMGAVRARLIAAANGEGQAEAKAEPATKEAPATFEAHGKTWTRHMPGDPCPCDLRASVYVAFKDGTFSGRPGLAVNWAWGTYLPDSEWLIGWRYADEPAQAEAANTDTEWNEYQQELMSPLPKPWTPRPGDVVRLKSGGPVMTVEAPNKDSNTFCSWFDGNGINQRFFPAACLTPVKKLQS